MYWNAQIAATKLKGYVETFGGRRVIVRGNWTGANGWSMASTSINYRIQGTGADQKYLAIACIRNVLTELGAYFAWDLHDGIYLYVPTDRVEEAAIRIKHILDNLPYKQAWDFEPPIPLPWDCKVSGSWGALKEYEYGD
jgi:DNA polymerase I-like protein with 3'-5' exonuclease and polymerase domains